MFLIGWPILHAFLQWVRSVGLVLDACLWGGSQFYMHFYGRSALLGLVLELCLWEGGQFRMHFYGRSALFYIRGNIYSEFVCALATVDVVSCFNVLSCVKLWINKVQQKCSGRWALFYMSTFQVRLITHVSSKLLYRVRGCLKFDIWFFPTRKK